mgnify:CR=1 FL=1
MNYIRTLLFLVVCFAAGAGIAEVLLHFRAAAPGTPTAHTGVGNAPPLHGFALPADPAVLSPALLDRFKALHASAVSLEYPRAGLKSTALAQAVTAIKKRGLSVALVPTTLAEPAAHDSADENPYPRPLAEIAQQAQDAGVDVLCISWITAPPPSGSAAYWTAQITAVRKHFHGQIVLAASADLAPSLDDLASADYLGVIGPVHIPRRLPGATGAATLDEMRVYWASQLDMLESLALRSGKPVVLLHMEVPANVSITLPDPAEPPAPAPLNPSLQELSYQALLTETKGRLHTEGLFLVWNPAATADTGAVNGLPALLPKLATLWASDTPHVSTPIADAAK